METPGIEPSSARSQKEKAIDGFTVLAGVVIWNVTLIMGGALEIYLFHRLCPFVCEGDTNECVWTEWGVICTSLYIDQEYIPAIRARSLYNTGPCFKNNSAN